jgi:hypothetical protein
MIAAIAGIAWSYHTARSCRRAVAGLQNRHEIQGWPWEFRDARRREVCGERRAIKPEVTWALRKRLLKAERGGEGGVRASSVVVVTCYRKDVVGNQQPGRWSEGIWQRMAKLSGIFKLRQA